MGEMETQMQAFMPQVSLSLSLYPGGNPRANLRSMSHRCCLFEVAFVWDLTKETIVFPLGCLQGGSLCAVVPTRHRRPFGGHPDVLGAVTPFLSTLGENCHVSRKCSKKRLLVEVRRALRGDAHPGGGVMGR